MAVKIVNASKTTLTDPHLDVAELAEGDKVAYLGDPGRTLTVSRTTATRVIATYVGPGARIVEKKFWRGGRLAGAPLGGTLWDRLVPLSHPRCKLARAGAQVSGAFYELDNLRRDIRSSAGLERLAEIMAECSRIVESARKAVEAEL